MYCVLVCVCGVVWCDVCVWVCVCCAVLCCVYVGCCLVWCTDSRVAFFAEYFWVHPFVRCRRRNIVRPDRRGSRTNRNAVRSMNLHDVRLKKITSSYAINFFLETFHKMWKPKFELNTCGTWSANADIDTTTLGLFRKRNTERGGCVLRGIWLESWPKAHNPDWILRTCILIDFMAPFVHKVVELLALLLPILKFSFKWLVLLLRIMNSQIPGGYLDIISDTWPVFPSGSPNKMPEQWSLASRSFPAFLRHRVSSNPGGVNIFQKFRSNLKILGPGRVTRRFDISRHGDPALGTSVPVVCSSDDNNVPAWGIPLWGDRRHIRTVRDR